MDLSNLQAGNSYIIMGGRCSYKTTFVQKLLHLWENEFETAHCFVEESEKHHYQHCCPKTILYPLDTAEVSLRQLPAKCAPSNQKSLHLLIVDAINLRDFKLKPFFNNARHYNLIIIGTCQSVVDIPVCLANDGHCKLIFPKVVSPPRRLPYFMRLETGLMQPKKNQFTILHLVTQEQKVCKSFNVIKELSAHEKHEIATLIHSTTDLLPCLSHIIVSFLMRNKCCFECHEKFTRRHKE
jgi:hypothetical protein